MKRQLCSELKLLVQKFKLSSDIRPSIPEGEGLAMKAALSIYSLEQASVPEKARNYD